MGRTPASASRSPRPPRLSETVRLWSAATRVMRQRAALSDHLIRLEEERRRDSEVEGLGGLEIDDQLEFRGLLYGQVSRLGAFEDLIDKSCGTLVMVRQAWPIAYKATGLCKTLLAGHRGEPLLNCHRCDSPALRPVEGIGFHQQRIRTRPGQLREGPLELVRPSHLQRQELVHS